MGRGINGGTVGWESAADQISNITISKIKKIFNLPLLPRMNRSGTNGGVSWPVDPKQLYAAWHGCLASGVCLPEVDSCLLLSTNCALQLILAQNTRINRQKFEVISRRRWMRSIRRDKNDKIGTVYETQIHLFLPLFDHTITSVIAFQKT